MSTAETIGAAATIIVPLSGLVVWAMRDYRQALLDWPEGTGFPDISTLPTMGTIKL